MDGKSPCLGASLVTQTLEGPLSVVTKLDLSTKYLRTHAHAQGHIVVRQRKEMLKRKEKRKGEDAL